MNGTSQTQLTPLELTLLCGVSVLLLVASMLNVWSLSVTEMLGFVTGGVCVWLTVREHMWTWPIGLANNVFFFALFFQARLFADMTLQVVYFGLGVYGWWQWHRNGTSAVPLMVSFTRPLEWGGLLLFIVSGTWAMHLGLLAAQGAAPFWDALTTALSLAAQYLLCRKRFESWYLWIVVDLIYVPLYLSRHLALTALLYGVFLLMCIAGLRLWRARLRAETSATTWPVQPSGIA